MKIQSNTQLPRAQHRCAGFALVELTITTGLGAFALIVFASLILFGTRSLVAVTDCHDLEITGSRVLELMSREIRRATAVSPDSTSEHLQLALPDGSVVDYIYDPEARTLTQQKGSEQTVLLKKCVFVQFNYVLRPPGRNLTYCAATESLSRPGRVKLVDVSLQCSGQTAGQAANAEPVRTARIVLRNRHHSEAI